MLVSLPLQAGDISFVEGEDRRDLQHADKVHEEGNLFGESTLRGTTPTMVTTSTFDGDSASPCETGLSAEPVKDLQLPPVCP